MKRGKEALSLDADGVVISRRLFPFQYYAVREFRKHGIVIYLPPDTILTMDRSPRNEPVRGLEAVSYALSAVRRVPKGVRETISTIDPKTDIFLNTGRSNKERWISMTKGTLKRRGILEQFSGFYFKPKGFRTVESKIAAVADLREQYEKVTHVDDNPADGLPIAKFFPEVDVIIVQDLSAGILFSQVEMREYPNVRRVATFRQGILMV